MFSVYISNKREAFFFSMKREKLVDQTPATFVNPVFFLEIRD